MSGKKIRVVITARLESTLPVSDYDGMTLDEIREYYDEFAPELIVSDPDAIWTIEVEEV